MTIAGRITRVLLVLDLIIANIVARVGQSAFRNSRSIHSLLIQNYLSQLNLNVDVIKIP